MPDLPPQPDPLSPEAQAILDAAPYPRLTGELTHERAQAIRASQAASRTPTVDRVAAERGITATAFEADGVPVVQVLADASRRESKLGRVLFLHGGGFTGGMARDMSTVLLADELGVPVWSVDYPLSPEARFPAAIDAAETAYRSLAAAGDGAPWAVIGVSAGANLALGLTQRLRAAGEPLPAALGLFTPWTDLAGHGDSRAANDGRDPVLRWTEQLAVAAAAYAGAAPLDDPLVSPIYATYDGFPPTIITTGTRDLFLSDCTRLYWAMRRAGVRTELRVWENLWHGFNTQHAVPEAAEARREVGTFVLGELMRRAAAPAPRPS